MHVGQVHVLGNVDVQMVSTECSSLSASVPVKQTDIHLSRVIVGDINRISHFEVHAFQDSVMESALTKGMRGVT